MTEQTQSAVADQAPLTIEQAIQLRRDQRASQAPEGEAVEAAEAPEPTEIEDAPQASESEASEPETDNAQNDEADPAEPAQPAIEPPHFWDRDGKEAFAKLSPEAQKEVVRYEQQRNAAVSRAQQQAAETRKAFEAKQAQLQNLVQGLEQDVIPEREARLGQWENWFKSEDAKIMARTDPGAFLEQQAIYREEVEQYQKAENVRIEAQATLLSQHVAAQTELLKEIAPDLADTGETGAKLRSDLLTFLSAQGYEPDTIRWISARDMAIARDAMLYRKGLALGKAAQQAAPKPKAGPQASPGGQGQRISSNDQRFKQLSAKSSLTQEEFLEMKRLRRK